MKHTKFNKLLSLLLSFVFILSAVIALPSFAEETAKTATVTLSADADLHVQNKAGTTAANETVLRVKSDNQTDNTGRRIYILFDTSSDDLARHTVKSAKIRLFCTFANAADAENRKNYKIYATSSEIGWSDDDAADYSFGTPPVTDDEKILDVDASTYPSITSASTGQWIEFDVTEYVKTNFHKKITFSIRNEGAASSNNHLTFNSSEADSNQPELVIETETVSLNSTYDLYVESNNTSTNYHDKETFTVKSENGSPVRRAYLMFDTAASGISDASDIGNVKLRMYCTFASTSTTEKANRKQYRLYAFTDYTWEDQTAVTWSAQPSSDTMELVRFIDASTFESNTWIEIDVTEYVKKHWGEQITFSLRNYGPSSSENHLTFSSSESTNGNAPALWFCTEDHTAASGIPVSVYAENDTKLSVYSCTCGGQWAYDQNGVLYRGENVYKVCEKYTLWTATDGSYRTYKTDAETLADHTLETSGRCSACQEWTYINYSFINSPAVRELKKVTGLSTPAYDATNEWLSAPQGGALNMYTGMATKSESNITPTPFVISFDFSVSAVLEGSSTRTTHWPLLRYRGKSGGTNYTTNLLSIGATGTVAADATETSERIYLVLGEDHTFADGEADAIFYLTKDEWYNIQIAVDPIARSYRVYVNGEFVGAVKTVSTSNMCSAGLDEDAKFMFGFQDGIIYRYNVGYKLDNISVTKTSSEYIHDLAPTNELIKINYEMESMTQSDFGYNTWSTVSFGSHTNLRATKIVTDGTDSYGFFSRDTGDFGCRISTTSYFNEKDISPLADGKYEVKMEFAIPDADADADGIPDATATKGTILRIMKYNANIVSNIVEFAVGGQYVAFGKPLYKADGVTPLTAVRGFDENDVPTDTSVLQVIIDENKGTYSIYVDNAPAYFTTSGVFTAAIDQKLTFNVPDAIKNADGYVDGETTYGDITKEMVINAGAKNNDLQSIRTFVNLLSFAVKEITVTEIPDDNVTLVGVQQRAADVTEGEAQEFDLRFVFGIDNLFTSNVLFVVEAYKNGALVGTQNVSVSAAYSAIVENGDRLNAWECVEGEYFVAFKIVGIEEVDASEYSFFIVPTMNGQVQNKYWISCDGHGNNIQVEVESESAFWQAA